MLVLVNFQAESLARGNLPVNGGYCHDLGVVVMTGEERELCGHSFWGRVQAAACRLNDLRQVPYLPLPCFDVKSKK